jgi:acetylglutamate kinase
MISSEKLYVVKIGGNIIDDELKLDEFLNDFAKLEGKKILIHGGGKLATKLAKLLNIPQVMVEGRRITDAETLKVITMVYAGHINKRIVAALNAKGCKSIGLTGTDGDFIQAHKRPVKNIDYGFVGDIDNVNPDLLISLFHQQLTAIVAPLTADRKGQLLNTNADTIAKEIAVAMAKDFEVHLVYTFEKRGVLSDFNNENSAIPLLNYSLYQQLKQEEKIFAGMLPKLDNAYAAISGGVKSVRIGDAKDLKLLVNGTTGTRLIYD